jgi:hypothetical protein
MKLSPVVAAELQRSLSNRIKPSESTNPQIWTAHEAFTDPKGLGKRLSNEGHGFSRAANWPTRLTVLEAAEVRFSKATGRWNSLALILSDLTAGRIPLYFTVWLIS